MGEPRKLRKRYSRPKVKHEGERIAAERKLVNKYGLKNKKEIWKAEAMGKNAAAFIQKNYSWSKVGKEFIEIYENVLK